VFVDEFYIEERENLCVEKLTAMKGSFGVLTLVLKYTNPILPSQRPATPQEISDNFNVCVSTPYLA
jgi:hypothetical protein